MTTQSEPYSSELKVVLPLVSHYNNINKRNTPALFNKYKNYIKIKKNTTLNNSNKCRN